MDDITDAASPRNSEYVLAVSAAISPIQGIGNAIIFNTAASTDELVEKRYSSREAISMPSMSV